MDSLPKKYLIGGIVVIIILGGLFYFKSTGTNQTFTNTQNHSNEPTLAQITYDNASADLIKVSLPYPGAVTGKEFKVVGEARGTWYFEAVFPVEVLDKDGNTLFRAAARASSDWMTTEFVPFTVDISIPQNYTGSATIVLKKDNPSGLAEKDASISFPIIIEY